MATTEKLREHFKTTKDKLTQTKEDSGNLEQIRKLLKKSKRLSRKIAKRDYAKKKMEEKSKSKKDSAN
tara:strand:+ start:212 stop:415 length:204 start_codon:yes stop_codon:yes gene_type:complete